MNLVDKAGEIRREHEAAHAAAVTAIEHALAAGMLLTEVKESLPHGEFGTWVAAQCGFSDRTARRYMQLHAHRETLPDGAGIKTAVRALTVSKPLPDLSANRTRVSVLGIRDPFEGPLGERPAYLPNLGRAAFTGDLMNAFWLVWEVEGNFAHALRMPVNADEDIATFTKHPIRYDYLREQLEAIGLPGADKCEWLPIALQTALDIRAIAAGSRAA